MMLVEIKWWQWRWKGQFQEIFVVVGLIGLGGWLDKEEVKSKVEEEKDFFQLYRLDINVSKMKEKVIDQPISIYWSKMECGKRATQSIRIVTMCPELSWGEKCRNVVTGGAGMVLWASTCPGQNTFTELVLFFYPNVLLIRHHIGTLLKRGCPR